MKNKLSELFTDLVLKVLEEGRKKLRSKYIPYPVLDVIDSGKDYIPVIIDGEGDGYLWVRSGKYYKKNYKSLFSRWRDVTSDLKEEVSRIYSRETKVLLPSKIAKFCGNISRILGFTEEGQIYEQGSQIWDIPEVSVFDQTKWPTPIYVIPRFKDIRWYLQFEKPWITPKIAKKENGLSPEKSKKYISELLKKLEKENMLSRDGKRFIKDPDYDYRVSPFMVTKDGVKMLDGLFGSNWYDKI